MKKQSAAQNIIVAMTAERRVAILTGAAAAIKQYNEARTNALEAGSKPEKVGGHPDVVAARNAATTLIAEGILEAIAHRENALWGNLLLILSRNSILAKAASILRGWANQKNNVSRARSLIQAFIEGQDHNVTGDEAFTNNKYVTLPADGSNPVVDTNQLLKRSREIREETRAKYEANQAAAKAESEAMAAALEVPAYSTAPVASSALGDAMTKAKSGAKKSK